MIAGTRGPGLPGIAVPGRPAGARPRELLGTGTLLLSAVTPGTPSGSRQHRAVWGAQPLLPLAELVDQAGAAGVLGAGGAGFPLARKLESLTASRVRAVIVNGSEGEPSSGKDAVLLRHVPHLVLDGAHAAAVALGAPRVVVRVAEGRPEVVAALRAAIAERAPRPSIEVSIGPESYIAGEGSAVIRSTMGGPALPADLGRPPRAPGRLPMLRRHVLLSNVETFARLAVASRGVRDGSALVSASGAVARPGVAELDPTSTAADLADVAGGLVGEPTVLITGGWQGRWLRWDARTAATPLSREGLASIGGRWGAGALVWLPADVPPTDALAAVARELAGATAGQCGPCRQGLSELATRLARAGATREGREDIEVVMAQVEGRGLCSHPSATVAALRSAMDLVGDRP